MPGIPVLKPREVISILLVPGFAEARHGSHKQLRHADGRSSTLPLHAGRDLSPTLLRQIARDIDLSVDDLFKHH